MNTFDLSLDLSKSRNVNPIRLRQGDLNGTTIRALIFDHGALADLSGTTARWVMRLPGDEEYYRKTATVDATACTVTVEVDETQAASVPGRCRGYFQILDGSTVIASTGDVLVEVLPDALEGATVAESYDSAIQDAIDALDAAVEAIPDTVEDVLEAHPEWVTTVQDGAVTDAKLYQGKGGILARNERLMHRLDNLLTAQLPEGDSATATDAAKTPLAGLALYGRSTQDGTPTPSAPVPIVSVEGDSEGNISLWARGKNLYHQTVRAVGSSETVNDATFTYADESSVLVDGTPTANTWKPMSSTDTNAAYFVPLPAGTYTASKSTTLGRVYVRKLENGAQVGIAGGAATSYTFTLDAPALVAVTFAAQADETYSDVLVHLQIERGTTPTAYVPYSESVQPIDLDGHELRSLPDGTRDELTVGADGRVTLVQRVGSVDLGTLTYLVQPGATNVWRMASDTIRGQIVPPANNNTKANVLCANYPAMTANETYLGNVGISLQANSGNIHVLDSAYNSASADPAAFKAAMSGVELIYALATPVTIDLGWTDAIPLCGPDLTAQAVPSAPFALTYERDLNVTLARLEAALAALA